SGSILLIVAVGLVGLLGAATLVVDYSIVVLATQRCQDVADAGALDQARRLNHTQLTRPAVQ
ncbi:MAG: pilus assembly protein TadG-related protein, partial [Armatimonadota bacterium]